MKFTEKRKVDIEFTDRESTLLAETEVFIEKLADELDGLCLYTRDVETIIENTLKGIIYIRDLEENGFETEDTTNS